LLHAGRVEMVLAGAKEGGLAAHLVAPRVPFAEGLRTQVLGAVGHDGVKLGPVTAASAATKAPVVEHDDRRPTEPAKPRAPPHPPQPVHGTRPLDVAGLVAAVERAQPRLPGFVSPGARYAAVIRLAAFDGDQLIGGCTMVVRDR